NTNMEKGLKLVSRIDPLMIDETIQTICAFNIRVLAKFKSKKEEKDKDKEKNNFNQKGKKKKKIKISDEELPSSERNRQDDDEDEMEEAEDGFGFDSENRNKGLTILKIAYFQIIILFGIIVVFLIPIFIEIKSLLSNVNNFLETKEYFYDSFIETSLSLLNIKLAITDTNITKYLEYNNDVEMKKKETITGQINKYSEMKSFYKYIQQIQMNLRNVRKIIYYQNIVIQMT
ncbi:MAG: hypothetical protein MJ252_18185, partial [archaeon]|nr:hypothetical protein [archaeon]